MRMSDVKCPHCGKEQEINHDDGYGYDEGERHSQHCSCGKEFGFTTSIMYCYEVFCADDKHEMEQPLPDMHNGFWSCENCDHSEIRR